MKGQVISGEFGKILIRQKSGSGVELGELLVSDEGDGKILLQVYDLVYGLFLHLLLLSVNACIGYIYILFFPLNADKLKAFILTRYACSAWTHERV